MRINIALPPLPLAPPFQVCSILEPTVNATIITPNECVGKVRGARGQRGQVGEPSVNATIITQSECVGKVRGARGQRGQGKWRAHSSDIVFKTVD